MSLGRVRTGAIVSVTVTVTVNEPVPVLPCASVAEQFTVVVPGANVLPDAGLHEGVTEPSTTSVAVASGYVTTFPPESVVVVEMSAGTDTCGGVVSCTTTSADAETVSGASVVVVHVTVVVPRGNVAVTENEPTPAVPSG